MIESLIEKILFRSRWLLAPLYLGLVGALLLLVIKFIEEFVVIVPNILHMGGSEVTMAILKLVDIVLIANLLLMIIFSGYENFVSKIDLAKEHQDRPSWMGTIDYGNLKLKVIGSIVAISSIELLKVFINIHNMSSVDIAWMVGLHLTFVVSGLLFALTERLAEGKAETEHK